ncbi:MAG: hypothetical protein R2695_19925 [Acidimicrobiales bacterium]
MDSRLQVAARPAPFELPLEHSAVIVVDMQNDFASVGGMFERRHRHRPHHRHRRVDGAGRGRPARPGAIVFAQR